MIGVGLKEVALSSVIIAWHKLLGRCVYLVDLLLCSYSKVRVSTAHLLFRNLDIDLLS